MKIGILCGHPMPDLFINPEILKIETPYGAVMVHMSRLGAHELFFIHRHSEQGILPPHMINYRGNIHALASCHVSCIFSIGTVGSMKKEIQPGDLVIPDDFIDETTSRPQTFYDEKRVHVDMTEPFCQSLREMLQKSCEKISSLRFHKRGVCLVTEGPRLETAAEIKFYAIVADIVGMTMAPEVILAREKGICFASLCLVCNMAAGLQSRLTADEIACIYTQKEMVISSVLKTTISSLKDARPCHCPVDISKACL